MRQGDDASTSRAEVTPGCPGSRPSWTRSVPQPLVCPGSSAARPLLGARFRVTQHRGEVVRTDLGVLALITVHPSSVLRAPDASRPAHREFVRDLRRIGPALDGGRSVRRGGTGAG
jgi:DNA polymerase